MADDLVWGSGSMLSMKVLKFAIVLNIAAVVLVAKGVGFLLRITGRSVRAIGSHAAAAYRRRQLSRAAELGALR